MTALLIDELSDPGVFTHGLALKPGKPTILGMDKKSHTLMVGLPGHPVAAMAVFEMLPVWLKRQQEGESEKLAVPAVLDGNVPGTPGRKMLLYVELKKPGRLSGQPGLWKIRTDVHDDQSGRIRRGRSEPGRPESRRPDLGADILKQHIQELCPEGFQDAKQPEILPEEGA